MTTKSLGNNNYVKNNQRYYYSQGYIHYNIRAIFAAMNVNQINIAVNHNSKDIANVTGINFNDFFNIPSFININLDFERIRNFDPDELLFILAHECGHVYHSHMVGNIVLTLMEKILAGRNNENEQTVHSLKAITAIINKITTNELLPLDAAYVKRIELEADKFAVTKITHDLDSAVRCLMHLCNNNTERESHIWEFSKILFPIMTMGERIQELKKSVAL